MYINKTFKSDTVLIYCHTFSGNRTEGKDLVPYLLGSMSVLLFDFVGCGNSEGEFLTLGINEAKDLQKIINYIRMEFNTKMVHLWGRSMGAVTIIHYLFNIELNCILIEDNQDKIGELKKKLKNSKEKDKKKLKEKIDELAKQNGELQYNFDLRDVVKAAVIDSSFTCARKMVRDVLKTRMNTSNWFTSIILMYLGRSLRNNTGVDILNKNKPELLTKFLNTPAVFMVGENDDLVKLKDFQKMFDDYNADDKKLRILTDTDHAESRKDDDIQFAIEFIKYIEKKYRPIIKSTYEFND